MSDFAFKKSLIQHFVLNERMVIYLLRQKTGLNRSDIEVLVYAANNLTFTVYQVQSFYKQAQLQTIRRAILKLSKHKLIENIGIGKVANAKVYMISPLGAQHLEIYYSLWQTQHSLNVPLY
jgi:hypothetical protein